MQECPLTKGGFKHVYSRKKPGTVLDSVTVSAGRHKRGTGKKKNAGRFFVS